MLDDVSKDLGRLRDRVTPIEETLPLKADRVELEAAIKAIQDELEKMNIKESQFPR